MIQPGINTIASDRFYMRLTGRPAGEGGEFWAGLPSIMRQPDGSASGTPSGPLEVIPDRFALVRFAFVISVPDSLARRRSPKVRTALVKSAPTIPSLSIEAAPDRAPLGFAYRGFG